MLEAVYAATWDTQIANWPVSGHIGALAETKLTLPRNLSPLGPQGRNLYTSLGQAIQVLQHPSAIPNGTKIAYAVPGYEWLCPDVAVGAAAFLWPSDGAWGNPPNAPVCAKSP